MAEVLRGVLNRVTTVAVLTRIADFFISRHCTGVVGAVFLNVSGDSAVTAGVTFKLYIGFPSASHSPTMRTALRTVGLILRTVPSSSVTSVQRSVDSMTGTSIPSLCGLSGVGKGTFTLRSGISPRGLVGGAGFVGGLCS